VIVLHKSANCHRLHRLGLNSGRGVIDTGSGAKQNDLILPQSRADSRSAGRASGAQPSIYDLMRLEEAGNAK
jgi:hypothetical protein